MDLGIPKCAITGCPNKSKLNPQTFKAFLQIQNITYHNQPLPVLHQNEPYTYLGIQLISSLNWNIQIHVTITKLTNQCKLLLQSPATSIQKIHMANIVIRPGIAYSFYVVPYSMPTIRKLDKKIIALHKKIFGLPLCTPNVTTQLPKNLFDMDTFSIQNDYLTCISDQLRNALNDTGRLGKICIGLTHYILAKFGGSKNLPRLKHIDCLRSPTTRTLYLLKDVGHIYIKSSLPNFPLNPIPLETQWLDAASNQPFLRPQRSLKLLHKLLLHHITDISHLILPNCTHLMSIPDFKTYYATPTTLIKQALTVAEQLFYHPPCTPHCHIPCLLHHPRRILLPQYVPPNHIILPRPLPPL
jgi:hypothetical protein